MIVGFNAAAKETSNRLRLAKKDRLVGQGCRD